MADCPRTDIQGRELSSFYVLVLEKAKYGQNRNLRKRAKAPDTGSPKNPKRQA